MKSIINGKRYDTEKADLLATASSNLGKSDFSWWREELYRTKRSKAFFLAGEGHARSHYAQHHGQGTYGPGEKITPLTDEAAFEWAQKQLTADEVEAIFADQIQDA